MKMLHILALLLALALFVITVELVWSLPFDVRPPKCYFCCDVNYDGRVDMQDVVFVSENYGCRSDMPDWNPVLDVNGDGVVNIADIFLVILCLFL